MHTAVNVVLTVMPCRPLIILDVDGVVNRIRDIPDTWRVGEKTQDDPDTFDDFRTVHATTYSTVNVSDKMIQHINLWDKTCDIVWLTSWRTMARDLFAPSVGLKRFAVHPRSKETIIRDANAVFTSLELEHHKFSEDEWSSDDEGSDEGSDDSVHAKISPKDPDSLAWLAIHMPMLHDICHHDGVDPFKRPTVWIDDHMSTYLCAPSTLLKQAMGGYLLCVDPAQPLPTLADFNTIHGNSKIALTPTLMSHVDKFLADHASRRQNMSNL
jgi:hypothetical protein